MCIERSRCLTAMVVWGLMSGWSGTGVTVWAQPRNAEGLLSAPIAGGKPLQAPPSEGPGGAIGSGAGHHSPNSPFAPLVVRQDVVPWSTLTAVKPKLDASSKRIVPVFSAPILALHQKAVRVQGYMMPLTPGMAQTHFLLSAVPLTCSFCTPGGPESIIEVFSKTPIPYAQAGIVVEGRLRVLPDDPKGLFYRMDDALGVKQ